MSSIEDASSHGNRDEGPGLITKLGSRQEIKIENSRRSVDSMQDSAGAWEASAEAEEAERKPARTSETIPVPAPSSTRPYKVSCKLLMRVVIIKVYTMAHLIR